MRFWATRTTNSVIVRTSTANHLAGDDNIESRFEKVSARYFDENALTTDQTISTIPAVAHNMRQPSSSEAKPRQRMPPTIPYTSAFFIRAAIIR